MLDWGSILADITSLKIFHIEENGFAGSISQSKAQGKPFDQDLFLTTVELEKAARCVCICFHKWGHFDL